ncbi:hypothetical protein JTE90_010303 [Oedothorax gibbosus]|uniref:Uncharacterized protein n=1 Tax=Oedothorax gibbosus TaxID=931172 RepID=A0AAV6V5A1_9ARAC|nr:hypothetical protein JTE90_010303 [Oedothorax gibbosus]
MHASETLHFIPFGHENNNRSEIVANSTATYAEEDCLQTGKRIETDKTGVRNVHKLYPQTWSNVDPPSIHHIPKASWKMRH